MAILSITKQDTTVVNLPDPASITWSKSDVEGSGSGINQNGDEFKDVVSTKRIVQVNWNPLNQSDTSTILNAITDTFFTLTFPDPQVGTASMVVGKTNVQSPMLSDIENTPVWKSLKIKFKER